MKKLSKLLALLLALALVFSLAACSTTNNDADGSKTDVSASNEKEEKVSDEDFIIGNWICQFDMGDAFSEMLTAEIGDGFSFPSRALYVNLGFDFNDGMVVMSMGIDEDSFDAFMDELVDVLVDYMVEMAEAEGLSKADLETLVQDEFGMGLEEYFDELVNEAMYESFDELFYESEAAYYQVDPDADRIYVAEYEDDLDSKEEYMEYSIDGDNLIINKLVDSSGEMTDLDIDEFDTKMPWVFEKQ